MTTQDPFSMIQGATKRVTLAVTNAIPAQPPVVATVSGNVITFSGTSGTGLSAVILVTLASGAVLSYSLEFPDDASLDSIATYVAASLLYTDTADETQSFTSEAIAASVTVGSTPPVANVAVTIAQTNVANLTGCTAVMMVRASYASPAILTLTTPEQSPGGLVIDTTAGTITFTISAAQSAALPVPYTSTTAGTNQYASSALSSSSSDPFVVLPFDVKLVYPSGDVVILDDPSDASFALTVYGAVTR